jgi:hypothetical protein
LPRTIQTGRPKRFEGKSVRIPMILSEEEDIAFKKAREKMFPGAATSYVLRYLIADFCKDAGIKWPEAGKTR